MGKEFEEKFLYLNSNADTSGFTGALHLDKHKKVLENRIYN